MRSILAKVFPRAKGKADAAQPTSDPTSDIGHMLVKMNACSPAQVEIARGKQASEEHLGDALVRLGFVPRAKVDTALAFQSRWRRGDRVGVLADIVDHRARRALTGLRLRTPAPTAQR